MQPSLKIAIVNENPIRAAILEDGLREAGHVVRVVRRERRGRGVVAPPPGQQLLGPELLLYLRLVLPLQVPVVALVEPPVPAHREPAAPGRGQGELGSADGPGQDRGVEHPQIERALGVEGRLGQEVPAGPGLGLARLGQVHVHPPREQVLRVPGRLAVAEEDEVEHGIDRRAWGGNLEEGRSHGPNGGFGEARGG